MGQALDLRQQGARGFVTSSPRAFIADDEVTQFNVGAA
jgi:hypothetical protein